MSEIRPKNDAKVLCEVLDQMELAMLDAPELIEEWCDGNLSNRAAVVRCIEVTPNGIAVIERTIGNKKNLEVLADLIVNDEHDPLYEVVSKIYGHESSEQN